MTSHYYTPALMRSWLFISAFVFLAIRVNGQELKPTDGQLIKFTGKEGLQTKDSKSLLDKELGLDLAFDDLRLRFSERPAANLVIERFDQYFKTIKVVHGSFAVASKSGVPVYAFGKFYHIDPATSIMPTISGQEARRVAIEFVPAKTFAWQYDSLLYPKGELVFVEDFFDKGHNDGVHLAYVFNIYALEPLSRSLVYVDARTGQVLFQDAMLKPLNSPARSLYSDTVQITERKRGNWYYLDDTVRGRGIVTYNLRHLNVKTLALIDSNNAAFWATPSPAIDAHWAAEKIYDYWKTRLNRSSWDGSDSTMRTYVHYMTNFANAFWDGTGVFLGDGNPAAGVSPFTSLDICAHEFGHGLCQATANLAYSFAESGALNEGFSDIWGAVIESYADPHETDPVAKNHWTLAEEITNPPIRSLQDPNLYYQPDTYNGDYWSPTSGGCNAGNDYCGVHTNSGVLNYWFYLLSDGGKGTNDIGSDYQVRGIGIDSAALIAYLTELTLNSTANYAACRATSIAASSLRFGACSRETEAVTHAWYAVGVGADYVPCTPRISFISIAKSVTEDANQNTCAAGQVVNIPIVLKGPALSGGNATITLAVAGGTAVSGVDYTFAASSLTFIAGGATTQYLQINVIDNSTITGKRYVDLALSLNAGTSNATISPAFDTLRFEITEDESSLQNGRIEQDTLLTLTSYISNNTPFYGYFGGGGSNIIQSARIQNLYRVKELQASGLRPNMAITAAAMFVYQKKSTQPFNGFNLRLALTTQRSIGSSFLTPAFTTVYSGNFITNALAWNTLSFSSPFIWNGTDNVLMESCFDSRTVSIGSDNVYAHRPEGSMQITGINSDTSIATCSITQPYDFLSDGRPVLRLTQVIPPTNIQHDTSQYRLWRVPAMQQTFFCSPDSAKKLVATISNSSSDLSCVSACVSQSGDGMSPAISGGLSRTVKEFSILSSAVGLTDTIEVTLFFTSNELPFSLRNNLHLLVTASANDTLMTAANTEIIPVSGTYSSPTFNGFSGIVHRFGRFYLTDGMPLLSSSIMKKTGDEYWTGQNPFTATPTLFWNLSYSESVVIRLTDLTGKEVYNAEHFLEAGRHRLTVPASLSLHTGVYVLQVTGRHGVFLKKVTKI